MRESHWKQAPRDNDYNNDDTRAIDRQRVTAPQYWIGSAPPSPRPDPGTPPSGRRKSRRNASGKPGVKAHSYDVRRERTKGLKLDMQILAELVHRTDTGALQVQPAVRAAMRQRLQLMGDEKTRRDLRDLAAGKTQRGIGTFHSLGARVRVA